MGVFSGTFVTTGAQEPGGIKHGGLTDQATDHSTMSKRHRSMVCCVVGWSVVLIEIAFRFAHVRGTVCDLHLERIVEAAVIDYSFKIANISFLANSEIELVPLRGVILILVRVLLPRGSNVR